MTARHPTPPSDRDRLQPAGIASRAHAVAVVICIVVVALLLYGTAGAYSNRTAVERHLAAVREMGQPVTPDELHAWYWQPPPNRNAAAVWIESFKQLADISDLHEQLPPDFCLPVDDVALDAQVLAAMDDAVQRNRAALSLAYDATAYPACRFPVDLTQSLNTRLPHLGYMTQLGRLMSFDAVAAARDGRPQQVVVAIEGMLGIAHALRNEPAHASFLRSMFELEQAARTLSFVLDRVTLDDVQLGRLERAFHAQPLRESLCRLLVAERVLWLYPSSSRIDTPGMIAAPDQRIDRVLSLMQRVLSIAEHAPEDQMLSAIDGLIVEAIDHERADPSGYDLLLTRHFIAAYVDTLGRMRAAAAELAGERYRMAHDDWPATPWAVSPARASDRIDPAARRSFEPQTDFDMSWHTGRRGYVAR